MVGTFVNHPPIVSHVVKPENGNIHSMNSFTKDGELHQIRTFSSTNKVGQTLHSVEYANVRGDIFGCNMKGAYDSINIMD